MSVREAWKRLKSKRPKKPLNRGRWQPKRRARIRYFGPTGRRQAAWNASMMTKWVRTFGRTPDCAVTGGHMGGVDVGHIEPKDLRPDLRYDESNVAPISKQVNRLMDEDLAYRVMAQRKMKEWVVTCKPAVDVMNRA